MRIGLFPFVVAAAAAALALVVVGVSRLLRGGRPLGWISILLVLLPLSVVNGIVCLYFMISAGLSHSATSLHAYPWKCLGSTAVLVVLPSILLVTVRHGQRRRQKKASPPPGDAPAPLP